jgi:hypothetical protein
MTNREATQGGSQPAGAPSCMRARDQFDCSWEAGIDDRLLITVSGDGKTRE